MTFPSTLGATTSGDAPESSQGQTNSTASSSMIRRLDRQLKDDSKRQTVITVIDFQEEPTTQEEQVVHLVLTEATLLSGKLDECQDAYDQDCEAGVAAVSAFTRHLIPSNQPHLVFPKFEKQSQFVQVHPLGWNVNRLILQGLFRWNIMMSTPSLLLQNARDNYGSQRDLTYLQNAHFPFLLTNVNLPPSNSWATDYHEYVHFDPSTHIALISIANSGEPLNHDQIQSAWGALYTIADRNQRQCPSYTTSTTTATQQELYESYQDVYNVPQQPTSTHCWIPVVSFDDSQPGQFQHFLQGVMKHPHPPALIIDVDNNAPELYPLPTLVQLPNTTTPVWIHSFGRKDDVYYQHELHRSSGDSQLSNVTLIQQDMEQVPDPYKDELYQQHILYLRQQANQAIQNDPIVGYSTEFPIARQGEYRRCQGGECEIGNLFTDAIRWKARAQVAFVTSGGLRGDGWPAGPVHVSNIWAALPFPNSLCQGVASGKSLFQLLDYAISISTFESEDTNDGGRLLQVSGMNIQYNTQIPRGQSRLIDITIWNAVSEQWEPIQPWELYSFATDSYLCGAYDPYPDFLGANGNFTLPGEVPGAVGDDLVQDIVAQYLQQLTEGPYDAAIQGRLVNNTMNYQVLDIIPTQEECEVKTYWSFSQKACFPCPESQYVEFSDDRLEFEGQLNLEEGGIVPTEESKHSSVFNATSLNITDPTLLGNVLQGRILLINREVSNFSVVPKAIPSWLKFVDLAQGHLSDQFVVGGPATPLPSGGSLALDFVVGNDNLQSGTALGTVSFGVLGSTQKEDGIRTCDDYSRDATFDVFLSISPPQELNHIGNFRYIGLSLMAIALATACYFGYILYRYRQTAILKTMQPMFLITICIGIFIMALTILPMSLDDQTLSEDGADAACMAIPWLLSMGMTVTFSALFSKLWRVNKLFNFRSLRRMKVTAMDVMMPFILLFTLNTVLLTTWNVLDPLRSVRLTVEGEEWKSYASCRAGDVGNALMYGTVAVNATALLLACYQAYQARNISGEFAESKGVGLAIGCWLQVLLVGFPVLFLVDPDDITASYFLRVGLLFVLCMSMLCIIFGPLIMMVFQYKKNPGNFTDNRRAARTGAVFVSGIALGGNDSHYERNSFHSASGNGPSQRAHDPFHGGAMRAVAAVPHGDLSASGSSLGSSINYSPHDLKTIREEWQDEETGGERKSLQERKPSTQSTDRLELHNDEEDDSLSASSSQKEQPTEQMLLDDLVPRKAMDSFRELHESDSTVPFGGGSDFLLDNPLLASDDSYSDSSVPFQVKDESDDKFSDESDKSSSASLRKHTPLVPEDDSHSSVPLKGKDNPLDEREDRPDKIQYSQHLLHSNVSSKPVNTCHESPAKPKNNTQSPDEFKEDEALPYVDTALIIATIENGRAKRSEEIPFSPRFVGYKNRLSLNEETNGLAPEDVVRAAIQANHSSKRSARSSAAKLGNFMGMKDRSDCSHGSHSVGSNGAMDQNDIGRGRRRVGTGMSRSDPSHMIQPRVDYCSRRSSTHDYSRRRQPEDTPFPWEEQGKRASDKDMLGYALTEEWQSPEAKKKSNGLKGKFSALQSFLDSPKKKKGAFSTLHQSFSALNFTPGLGGGALKDEAGGGSGGDSPRRVVKKESPLAAALSRSVPALHYNHSRQADSGSEGSLELYENEPNDSTHKHAES